MEKGKKLHSEVMDVVMGRKITSLLCLIRKIVFFIAPVMFGNVKRTRTGRKITSLSYLILLGIIYIYIIFFFVFSVMFGDE